MPSISPHMSNLLFYYYIMTNGYGNGVVLKDIIIRLRLKSLLLKKPVYTTLKPMKRKWYLDETGKVFLLHLNDQWIISPSTK